MTLHEANVVFESDDWRVNNARLEARENAAVGYGHDIAKVAAAKPGYNETYAVDEAECVRLFGVFS